MKEPAPGGASDPRAPDTTRERSLDRQALFAAYDLLLLIDDERRITAVEGDPMGLLGASAEELVGAPLGSLIPEGLAAAHDAHVTGPLAEPAAPQRFVGSTPRIFARHRSGRLVPVEPVIFRVEGDPRGRRGVVLRDAHALLRMDDALLRELRASRVLRAVHAALASADDMSAACRAVCGVMVAECGYPLAWVGLAERDERRTVRPIAKAGQDQGYVAALDVVWSDTERGRGPTGTAIREGRSVVAARIASAPGFDPWRSAAEGRYYAASISVPIRVDGVITAALSIYAREADAFPQTEVELIEEIADRLGHTTEHIAARAALHADLERRIAERTAELHDLYENAPCGYHTVGADGTILRINATELRWLGYSREEVIGRPVGMLLAPDSAAQAEHVIDTLARGEQAHFAAERVFMRKDGSTFPVFVTAAVARDAEGRFLEARATLVDISDRKLAEAAVRERDALLRDVLDRAGDCVFVADAEHRIRYVNRSWCEVTGYSAEEAASLTILDLAAPEELEQARASAEAYARLEHEGPRRFARTLRSKSGKRIPIEGVVTVDRAGTRYQGMRCFFADVSERRAAEEEVRRSHEALAFAHRALQAASQAKDEFLASMSHELRTPLNGILGTSEVLAEGVYGPLNREQQAAVGRVEECGRHLLDLINDILDLAKVEAGKLSLARAPTDVHALVQQAIRLVMDGARRKRLQVEESLGPLPGPVLLDERRIKQVVVNLLANAVKFTPQGGAVGVAVQARDGLLEITVWDTGIGIAEADRARLFQPFVQLDSRLARAHEGTGLGLALVRRLVELHAGTVTLESEPGAGSRFTVSIPIPASTGAGGGAAAERGAEAREGGLVLLAEDDEVGAEVITDMLRFAGYEVRRARDGVEAVAMARALAPRVILMDVQMPRLDGLAAIRAIRAEASAPVRDVPIVALTALAMRDDRERCLAAGADEYLAKPVSLRALLDTVRTLSRGKAPPP